MIRFLQGNLFASRAEALVNTVNCVGVMGKGIAYQFKRAYPLSSQEYMARCKRKEVKLGSVTASREAGRWIIQFPTKGHWKENSRLADVEAGIDALRDFLREHKIRSVAIPPLGCGNGGLRWSEVRESIVRGLGELADVEVEVYEPATDAVDLSSRVADKPRLSLSAVVVAAMRVRIRGSSKLALHKGLYFFDVFASQDYFRFKQHHFGPWCPDVDRLAQLLRDYLDFTGIDRASLVEQALRQELSGVDVERFNRWLPAIDAAARLVNEEYPSIEALATVHALLARSAPHPVTEDQLVEQFFAWSEQKSANFVETHVREAVHSLARRGLARLTLLGWEAPVSPKRVSQPEVRA